MRRGLAWVPPLGGVRQCSPLLAAAARTPARRAVGARARRPPPPPPGAKHRLPPPPPLRGCGLPPAVLGAKASSSSSSSSSPGPAPSSSTGSSTALLLLPWKSPHEVLSAFVEYVPTFWVSVPTVAAILPEEMRALFIGRGRFLNFLRRYPFLFDLRVRDGGVRVDVQLHKAVSHPQRGVADEKFMMVDVGEVANYVAKPSYIVSTDSIEQSSQSVNVVPPSAPPAVRVQLEERVPVLERLCELVPAEFTPMDALEDELPEDIVFHPYFDCQGGLPSIAVKFPQCFQVVDGKVRLRPPHLAPLALHEFTLEESPLPSVADMVKHVVCDSSDIPHWVSLTSLYERLSKEEKQSVKKGFKSFAGFLRAHGRSLAVSQDMLHVSMWIPPVRPSTSSPRAGHEGGEGGEGGPQAVDITAGRQIPLTSPVKLIYTHTQVLNELFDRFPPHRTLSLTEALALLPRDMAAFSLPRNVLGWLACHPQYFTVENPTETQPDKVRLRRASEHQPLDLALAVYTVFPGEHAGGEATAVPVNDAGEASAESVLTALLPRQRAVVRDMGWPTLVHNMLPEWLAVRQEEKGSGMLLRRLRTLEELEKAIHTETSKGGE